ncbi:class D sortase [Clostridium botulinum]|uniref:class D sortase n=1 Tax=Clostridium botulinum TaxID=1491 RepID=UPI0004D9C1A6|nr:class D sortase [Clostridium botulinum]KEI01529.1 sortase [Clostridium botulinum C/D str. BKT75002]KEI07863.1 sortase [Clostridium botulinum C/D str. BKT2873]KGM95501.1 sortase [Clostridium botulinum D str. CCUG 7971]KOC46790.1 sortase [Clostridium botulinum]
MKKTKKKYISLILIILAISTITYSVYEILYTRKQIKSTIKKFDKINKDKHKDNKEEIGIDKDILGILINEKEKIYIPVVEGITNEQLKKGAGHYSESQMPPDKNECFLFGHRDTVFSCLKDIKSGDKFVLKTKNGEFKYKVSYTKITSTNSKQVLKRYGEDTLILVTCYPFNYIGSAPKRFVVVCKRYVE